MNKPSRYRLRTWSLALLFITASVAQAQSDWTRYRLFVKSSVEAERVTNSDLTLFSERVSVGETDIVIGPGEKFKLWTLGIPYQFVSKLPDPRGWDRIPRPRTLNYRANYYRYNEIVGQYEEWRLQNPLYVTRMQIGTSIQGRAIWAYRVGTPARNPEALRSYVVNFGIHAREWISPSVGMHVFKRLLDGYLNGEYNNRNLFAATSFYFVPSLNPDGYEYSWTNNRMWRKNRRDNPGSSFGVDLNRNFPTAWGGAGSSGNAGSDTYRGTAAASEPETQALINLTNQIGPLAAIIDFHSYGEYILWPWSYTETMAPGNQWLAASGLAMKQAVAATHGHQYTIGQASTTLYVASGTTKDHFYAVHNAASYTVELRDKGQNGFILPESQISDTQDEAYAAFYALALRMLDR